MVNSRAMGVRGELEVVKMIDEYGFEARRGQQYAGGPDSPDIVHNIPDVHVEVKRTERFRVYDAIEQATEDCDDMEIPVVFYRSNHGTWLVVQYAADWLETQEALREANE